MTVAERFWSHVDKSDTCWTWRLRRNKGGYGTYWFHGSCWLAHRVAWQLSRGGLGTGRPGGDNCILHRCDNPACVRPSHLFLAPQTANIADMCAKGRQRGACGARNARAKLTPEQVQTIRNLQTLASQRSIAREFGISRDTVRLICTGASWQ